MSDEGNVGALALHIGHTDGNRIFALGHFTDVSVKNRVLHDVNGVVVADGGLHKALGVVGRGRTDDLETGGVGDEVFRRMAVRRADTGAAIGRTADNDGAVDFAAAHVAHAGGVVDDLVPCHVGE